MIKLLRNHKKSVSPVIAVVLLIALTVAAGAIIWTIVLPLLEPTETLTITNTISSETNTTGLIWKGTFDATSAGSISSVVLDVSGGNSVTGAVIDDNGLTVTSATISSGANTLRFYFSGVTTAGSGTITITWTPDGGSSTTYSFEVTWT